MNNLKQIFDKYDIKINKNQENQFDIYFKTLIETNKKFNLTAITEENEVIIKHFLDSVLPNKNFHQNATVIDVGSGAGFPSIPLKIIRPDLKITMIDSLNKRVNFLNETINVLNLKDIEAIHSRAEEFAQKNREKFDYATARAVASLDTLCEYLIPFVKIGGFAIIYKSNKLDEEIKIAEKAIKTLGAKIEKIENYHIEESDLGRQILILKKIYATPQKYPRGQNKPKIAPIR